MMRSGLTYAGGVSWSGRSVALRAFLLSLILATLGVATSPPSTASAARYVVENWNPSTGDWHANPSLDFIGWTQFDEDPALLSLYQNGSQGRGLYGHSELSTLSNGAVAEWRYTPPGTSTVFKSEYEEATFNLAGCLNEGMRLKSDEWEKTVNEGPPFQERHPSYHPTACGAGVVKPPVEGRLIVGNPGPQVFCAKEGQPQPCGLYGSPLENSAAFGIERFGLIQTPFSAYLRGIRVYETSYVRPYFTGATNTIEGWVRAGTGTIRPSATETGLGMKTIRLGSPKRSGGTGEKSLSSTCTGTRLARCPATWNKAAPAYSPSFAYNVEELPEGVDHFGVKAIDIVENEGPATGLNQTVVPPTRVDRTAPANATASGELVGLVNQYINGQGTKTVTVSATDNLSGIRRLSVEDEGHGVLASYAPASCKLTPLREDQCPLSASGTLTVNTAQMPEGANHLRVVAEDLAGNVAYGASWTVYVDRIPPTIELSGPLTEGLREGTDEYPLHVHAADAGSGVKSVTISVDGQIAEAREQSCPGGKCSLDLGWTYDSAARGAGPHVVEVVAVDQVGQAEGSEIELEEPDGSVVGCSANGNSMSAPSEITPLGNGGSSWVFHGKNQTYEEPLPPGGFEPLKASASELSMYGFPPRPSEAEALAEWERTMSSYRETVASDLCVTPASVTSGSVAGGENSSGNSPNWGGYSAHNPSPENLIVAASGEFVVPFKHPTGCAGADDDSWVGIGGNEEPGLVQGGIRIESNGEIWPFYNYVQPQYYHPDLRAINYAVHKEDKLRVYVSYQSANDLLEVSYFDNTTGKHHTQRVRKLPHQFYSGHSADFIDERPQNTKTRSYLPLINYGTTEWLGARTFTQAGGSEKLSNARPQRILMEVGGTVLSGPGYLKANGKSFTDNFFRCRP